MLVNVKAVLTEDRPAYAKSNSGSVITVRKGEEVRVIKTDEGSSNKLIAEYKGLYVLCITTEQAEPLHV